MFVCKISKHQLILAIYKMELSTSVTHMCENIMMSDIEPRLPDLTVC